ncbi:MAG: DNA polymerase III subunit alpha, partial [Pseudomonadales bacterium]|nr:DNA polymerase III subunit alpha [Pseudomonadales bacterium]
FLNPERVSMPDFDVDFCMDTREKVIDYVAENYGRMAVSQIVTFGTMAAKAVVRDVARVQSKPYSLADRMSKAIPFTPGITLQQALEQEEPLREMIESDEDAKEIWDMAIQLEGTVRGVGKHAGGVVIAPTKLTDFAAIYSDENGQGMVTQFDKNDVEEAGLVKFDFLGLRTLTIIDWAKAIIDKQRQAVGESELIIEAIPLDDPKTYELLKRAETTAVFQLESRGMKELIKKLQPDNLEDMIALVALFRPGPLDSGMVDDFVNRKHGRAELAYPDAKYQHQWLEPILKPTYGVIVYQEQVMQIAQVLAGYSLGGADLLRRAMGKKKPEEMAKQREVFRQGAISQGVDPELAMKIFDLVEKFAGYGFNKSHSAAYALVSYHTAWLKTHYPAPFMAAVLSSELQNTDKIVTLVEECRQMQLSLMHPDVNTGDYMFTVDADNHIIYGLGAIKGLGEGPVEAIIDARTDGPFSDLFDFCRRIDLRKMNRRAIEALIKSGAFDGLSERREVLLAALPEAVQAAEQQHSNQAQGMVDLFAAVEAENDDYVYANYQHLPIARGRDTLAAEKETLGLFLSGHPIEEYSADLNELNVKRLHALQADKKLVLVAGMVADIRYIKTKRGDNLAIITLDDQTGRIDATVFASMLDEVKDKLVKDAVIFVQGEVESDDFSGGIRLRVQSVMDMSEVRAKGNRKLFLRINSDVWQRDKQLLMDTLSASRCEQEQGCAIAIQYQNLRHSAQAMVKPDELWRIQPSDALIDQLTAIIGADNFKFA